MARSNGGSRIGRKANPSPKYKLGEPEEIANRTQTGYQPPSTSFSQIGPGDHGGNLNEPGEGADKKGEFKYTQRP